LDWVLYFSRDDRAEGQCTVVTEGSGVLRGRRVVRGRELECETYYRETSAAVAGSTA
jgi:putative hydrolase